MSAQVSLVVLRGDGLVYVLSRKASLNGPNVDSLIIFAGERFCSLYIYQQVSPSEIPIFTEHPQPSTHH